MKYNWNIIGHEKQLRQIEADIAGNNIAHAYLLTGPDSIGKRTVARKFAGILQCESDFCHICPTCIQVEKGGHMDTYEVLDEGESIKIEEVRKLVERCNMSKQAKYKVFILENVERMTTEAANSLLKSLEEPPNGTIFILTCNNLRQILPTIVSRTRVVKFNNVSLNFLKEKIREIYPEAEEETMTKVGLFSMGKTGKAIDLMESPEKLAQYMKIYHDIENFLHHRNVAERFGYMETLLEEGENLEIFFNLLIHVLRSRILDGERRYIETVVKAEEACALLSRNVNSRLVLENLMLAL